MENYELLEPLDLYNSSLKDEFKNNAEQYFDELVAKSQVNVEENRNTVKEYNELVEEINSFSKQITKLRNKRAALIFLEVFMIILGAVFIFVAVKATKLNWLFWILAPLLIVCSIVMLFTVNKKLKKKIKELDSELTKMRDKASALKNLAYQQLAPLNELYDYDICAKLVNKTTPLFEMDNRFDPSKYMLMHDKFGFEEYLDKDESTLNIQSGSILGNPFILTKVFRTWIGQQTYTGHLTITWTTTYRDSQGRLQTTHHTQTLEASLTKPKPFYSSLTKLIYANEACPNLSFSRSASKANSMSDKQLERTVAKYDKKLDKMVQKDIDPSDGSQFTRLHNTEFEALFNALNRDNEIEFRMLFTPLSQREELKIIKSKVPYGDDFSFVKKKKINEITSSHSQYIDYSCDPKTFIHYSIDDAKTNFVNYCCTYFRGFYFDMAPMIAIPLYQQTKTTDYIYGNNYKSNVTSFEQEVLLNSYNPDIFKPADCCTDIILKPVHVEKNGKNDNVTFTAYGYRREKRLDYVSKMGGDGKFHNVPVEWYEYFEVENTSNMVCRELNTSLYEYNKSLRSKNADDSSLLYRKGYISSLDDNSTIFSELIREFSQELKEE